MPFHLQWGGDKNGISISEKGAAISQLPLADNNCFGSRGLIAGFRRGASPLCEISASFQRRPGSKCPRNGAGSRLAPSLSATIEISLKTAPKETHGTLLQPLSPRGGWRGGEVGTPSSAVGSRGRFPPLLASAAVSLPHKGQSNSLQCKNEVLGLIEGSSLTLQINVLVLLDGML